MLDEKDLQAIAQLMAQQKREIIGELDVRIDAKMAQQKQEVAGELDARMDAKLSALEARMDDKLDSFKQETMAMMEAYFDPKFDLLAEGQKTLLETLAPKNRVEQLEEEVDLLKTVIRSLSRDVAELKKAQ